MTGRRNRNEVDRFLSLKPQGTKSLLNLTLLSVVNLLDQIPRLHTGQARAWLQRFLPSYVREQVVLFVTQSDDAVSKSYDTSSLQRISKFWSLLFSQHFHNIILPAELEEKIKNNIVSYLGSGLQNIAKDRTTGTLNINVAGCLASSAEDSLRAHLKYSNLLTVFSFKKGATNDMLQIIGQCCPLLQEINVTGSQRVNDLGVAALLGIDHSDLSGSQKANPLAGNLRFAKLRSTGVRVMGIRFLFQYAIALEGIRCSSHDVLQAIAVELKATQNVLRKERLKKEMEWKITRICGTLTWTTYHPAADSSGKALGLKYLDFSNCFPIISKFVPNLPGLIEVRIGADAPPNMRQSHQRLRSEGQSSLQTDIIQQEALKQLPKLEHLKTLVLKDFGQLDALVSLLKSPVGARLVRLDLHFMTLTPLGVNLAALSENCPNLEDLSICDSLVSWEPSRMNHSVESHSAHVFGNLVQCKLLRVTYADLFTWEIIPRHSTQIRTLNLESCSSMEDNEFQVIGSGHRLTFVTLLRLIANCPLLRWIGDLRDWTLLDTGLVKKSLPDWEGRKQDPREHAQDSMILFNTTQIVRASM
ncbi:hypothetical protein TCAL_05349 [Tigriopus californicus]|uniref:Uncharacterized protein n=1 Tax=Tigriopus californicus TaxID=6832 RepID=A0A553NRC9_TIGCA|nr:hypothetical protein TCAL_05349 [Tigriopus californicus]